MTTPDGGLARTNRALAASAGERPSADLPTQYVPASVEGPLYERWVARGYFEADAKSDKPPFCVVIPPPNVTGSLHVGHAFEHTLIDTLVRRRRMQGYEALWLPGMDHASIAVHALVERQLEAEGTSRRELGRERFIERTWEWKEQYGGRILDQMRRLGDGVDWSREAFTMDEPRSRAVQTIFKRLYDDGVIYRAERMVNWSPLLRSVLSDAEVDHREVEGELVSMRYGALDGSGPSVVVATTRVETMLGDTAVAVHPDDPRYAELVGQEIELPLTGRRIPVIADTHVDPDFGTGAVKVTPAHDPNDFAIGQRHGLPMPTIMDEQGRITGTGTEFDGLDRFEARVAVRERLREQGRIVAERRPYTHSVGHSERSKEPIEPRLSLQWFVGVAPLAKAAGDAVRDGRVRVHPPEAESRYFAWVDHLHDWCISRQLWWGHRIPVWYGPGGDVVCLGPDDEVPTGPGWEQDPDVLDTWFSSALWPFSTLGWPDRTDDLETFYPNQVLVTGYDILFFWVVRMMMMGLYANDGVQPFDVIALHGMIRDENGRKMSKSAGNVVDPIEWMDRYGADAVRFTLANAANPGTDGPVSERGAQSARNFCNKLWNTTRFALLNGASVERPVPPRGELTVVDRWVLSRLDATVAEVDALYEDFQFAKLTEVLYHFARDEVSDWYLELAKVPLGRGGSEAAATQAVLGHVLDVLLRLLHPVVPFVTDALWTSLTGGESVVIAPWPGLPAESRHDEGAERELAWLQEVVTDLRTFRTLQKLPPRQWIPTRVTTSDDAMAAWWATHEAAFRTLTRSGPPSDGFVATVSQQHAHTGLGELSVELDLSGTIDVAAERKRLERDLTAARKELHQTTAKLGNQAFLDRAPESVVVDVRSRKDEAQAEVNRVEDQLAGLPPADA